MMLSIIVAVHNQLFLEGIRRHTTGLCETIVVDNHPTDGSAEFFEANGWQVIRKRWLLVSLGLIVEQYRRRFEQAVALLPSGVPS